MVSSERVALGADCKHTFVKNSAVTIALIISEGEVGESLMSPLRAPGVLDLPVALASASTGALEATAALR